MVTTTRIGSALAVRVLSATRTVTAFAIDDEKLALLQAAHESRVVAVMRLLHEIIASAPSRLARSVPA